MVKQNHASSEEQIFCFPSISNLAPYAPWCFMPLSFENVLCALVNVLLIHRITSISCMRLQVCYGMAIDLTIINLLFFSLWGWLIIAEGRFHFPEIHVSGAFFRNKSAFVLLFCFHSSVRTCRALSHKSE